jgi:thiamine-phosphate pyrophosphorylase
MTGPHPDPAGWALMVLTDAARGRSHVEVARLAIEGGADAVQLREKDVSCRDIHAMALEIRRLTRDAGVAFIVNDRLEVALASDADGVHLGQEDLLASLARKIIGPAKLLGVSATSAEEALIAERDGADYIGFGPLFEARASKPDAGAPLGLERLVIARARCSLPIVGIGGIDARNAASVIEAGASGIAVISAVAHAEDIPRATRELRALVIEARERGAAR